MNLTKTALEKGFLGAVSVSLCVFVVKLLKQTLTTETRRWHREPPRIVRQTPRILLLLVISLVLSVWCSAQTQVTVKASNKLPITRTSQTIELSAKVLAPLGEKDLNKIHVRDSSGKELLSQAVDTDYDELHKPDIVIFQADFKPNETRTFVASAGKKHEYTKDEFKAYGRFVRERFDDFAWENDLIAHRTYGKALITWKGEPLTSSAIDIWSKRTSRLVINDWYMVDNYHADMGEGMDDYSAGATRGCGGSGVWANNQLFVPTNFVDSRVLTNGPIRVIFELVYEPFDVNGTKVSEVLRISLDAGSQLDHFQSFYNFPSGNAPLPVAIGLKKVKDEQQELNAAHGWLAIWEPMEKNQGRQGVTAVFDPQQFDKQAEDKQKSNRPENRSCKTSLLLGRLRLGPGRKDYFGRRLEKVRRCVCRRFTFTN